ncbi:long-chain fatty acid--CoA ligase [Alloscardovia theropitheci]|uniref:Acyl-CoA synthetase n=1 Tax=Alloscardovia theropitheci TaxID=2496842 RepID=A0A4V2MU57_9BIFI|nr:AMP-dependent synthetase/ligase [Alloscardovia theropitheci]TCD55089.1 long-chain fatty acid--CoA ligase [Alloscardovia theropitheci]
MSILDSVSSAFNRTVESVKNSINSVTTSNETEQHVAFGSPTAFDKSAFNNPHIMNWSSPEFPTTTFIDPESGLLTTTTEGVRNIPDNMSVYNLYEKRAQDMGEDILYTFKRHGEWENRTANQVLSDIRRTAKGLIKRGVKKGDCIAFMCQTSYEWDIFDAAVLAVGGILATIYDTDSSEQIRMIVNNSDASVLVVQTRDMYEEAEGAIDACPSLKFVSCLENGALEELQAYGHSISDEELDARIASLRKSDLCSIVYTSGSTSAPKGVEMTHENYLAFAMNLSAFLPDLLEDEKNTILMFLPQAHVFARAINYGVVNSRIHIYIATGISTLLSDLAVARPSIMIGVPRVFEKVYNAASQKAGRGVKGHVFNAAANAARDYMNQISENGHASAVATARRASFDPIVYSSLRQALGGRAKWLVCGGAPLDPQLLAFFRGAGLPVYEGYGMTETTAPCAFTPLSVPFHAGSVGIAFPGFSLRLAEDGEIQIKGAGAFKAYHKNPEATASTFTEDGWIASGDLGALTPEGLLYITGRKKDLIITAGGKNVSPSPIEEAIKRCPLVSQALVLGDKRPFISALITLDEPATRAWIESEGLNTDMTMSEIANNAAVRAEVQKFVDKANDGVSRAESVRKFIILPEEFSQDNGLLTASMKVIRPKVLARYQKLLDTQMYKPRKK